MTERKMLLDWITTTGAADEHRAHVPEVGCYVVKPHREGWHQLALESKISHIRVLVVCDNVEELKTFAASHAAMLVAAME